MQSEVRKIFVALAIPATIWGLVSFYYFVRSYTSLGFRIAEKHEIQVATHLVGTIFNEAFPEEAMTADAKPLTWKGPSYAVEIDPETKIMTVKSSRFVRDAKLQYNGWRWRGFANIPTRVSPIEVLVW